MSLSIGNVKYSNMIKIIIIACFIVKLGFPIGQTMYFMLPFNQTATHSSAKNP